MAKRVIRGAPEIPEALQARFPKGLIYGDGVFPGQRIVPEGFYWICLKPDLICNHDFNANTLVARANARALEISIGAYQETLGTPADFISSDDHEGYYWFAIWGPHNNGITDEFRATITFIEDIERALEDHPLLDDALYEKMVDDAKQEIWEDGLETTVRSKLATWSGIPEALLGPYLCTAGLTARYHALELNDHGCLVRDEREVIKELVRHYQGLLSLEFMRALPEANSIYSAGLDPDVLFLTTDNVRADFMPLRAESDLVGYMIRLDRKGIVEVIEPAVLSDDHAFRVPVVPDRWNNGRGPLRVLHGPGVPLDAAIVIVSILSGDLDGYNGLVDANLIITTLKREAASLRKPT